LPKYQNSRRRAAAPPRRDAQLRGTKAVRSDSEAGALANRRAADRYFMRYRIQRVRARLLGQDKRHAVSASPPPPPPPPPRRR